MAEALSAEAQTTIKDGDPILLFYEGKKWLVKVKAGGQFHTHAGIVDHDQVIGKPYGSWIATSLGEKVCLLKPVIRDIILKSERATQILYPKEWGYIITQLGIGPSSKVLEVGTGSGVFTLFAAYLVRPKGHIYSYEMRPEFHQKASRNISRAGLSDYVTLKLADARNGIDERGLDAAMIDVGDPESLLTHVTGSLVGSAPVAVAVPTVNQLDRVVSAMRQLEMIDIEVCELLLRKWETKVGALRPSTRMIGHTTYLIFARNPIRNTQLL